MQRFRVAVASVVILVAAAAASAQTSSVNGKVTNKEGAVVANATVSLVPPPSAMASMPGMRPGATDISVQSAADGTFQFDKIPAGEFVLHVDAPGLSRSSQQITVPTSQTLAISLEPLEVPGAEASPTAATAAAAPTVDALLDRIRTLEQRLTEFESTTVLSEPETRVKRIEIWVDKDGNRVRPSGGRIEARRSPTSASGPIAGRRSTRRSSRRWPTRRTRASASASMRPPSRSLRAGRPAIRPWPTRTPTRSPRRTCSSPPSWPSTRSSSPTSSRSAARRPIVRFPR